MEVGLSEALHIRVYKVCLCCYSPALDSIKSQVATVWQMRWSFSSTFQPFVKSKVLRTTLYKTHHDAQPKKVWILFDTRWTTINGPLKSKKKASEASFPSIFFANYNPTLMPLTFILKFSIFFANNVWILMPPNYNLTWPNLTYPNFFSFQGIFKINRIARYARMHSKWVWGFEINLLMSVML